MELLYQDNAIIVCIKPIGADSEDGKPNCMPALLRAALNLADDAPIYTVHRLDKQVSGVMVYAKTKQAAAALSTQMQQHQFTKEYRAVVEGTLTAHTQLSHVTKQTNPSQPTDEATTTVQTENTLPLPSERWEDLLYHDKRKNKVFAVKKERKGVKHAALRYKVLGQVAVAEPPAFAQSTARTTASTTSPTAKKNTVDTTANNFKTAVSTTLTTTAPNLTLLQIELETGRTHQIRVQCASRKLPLVGDGRYGSKTKGCDIALFSHKLSFTHPTTKEILTFAQDVPSTFPWCLF